MISLKTTSDEQVTLRHPHKMLASGCAEVVARNWQ